jgi:N-methylhydantoinase B/oxoprolinase/acetone carboxylase alpha subunit
VVWEQCSGGLAIERQYDMTSSGLESGAPGGLTSMLIIRRNGEAQPLATNFVAVPLQHGERLMLRTAGGAGSGKPR